MKKANGLSLLAALACAVAGVAAQGAPADHPDQYAPADIAAGARVYNSICVNCHGFWGTGVGGIDLGHGLLPRARTDAQLAAVITTGFPQAGMPAVKLSADELRGVIAYVRTGLEASAGPPVVLGDAARGRALFEGKGNCLSCHRVETKGQFAGPDLSDIGRARAAVGIQRSLLEPTPSMRPINRPVRAVTRDGKIVTGRRLNEDTYTVQIMTDQGRLQSLVKSELREWSISTSSPMPSFKDSLTPAELSDLLAYLVSLKG
jgi:putative heme-binding domain-containing protein